MAGIKTHFWARIALVVVFLAAAMTGCNYPVAQAAVPQPQPLDPTSWGVLGNLAYPSQVVPGGMAVLTDGHFTGPLINGQPAFSVTLLEPHTYGDLNGDGILDAAVLLSEQSGNLPAVISVEAVVNQGGFPFVQPGQSLPGQTVVKDMKIDDQHLLQVDLETQGAEAAQRLIQIYALQQGRLVLDSQPAVSKQATPVPVAQIEPQRVQFDPGAISTVLRKEMNPAGLDAYLLRASQGQTMTLRLTSTGQNAILSLYGADDSTVLASVTEHRTDYYGVLPTTQDYAIQILSVDGRPASYQLEITIVWGEDPSQSTPVEPTLFPETPTPDPGSDPVVYLTFDDGGDPKWTPLILDVLAKYDAHATFFVIGQNAERHPELVVSEAQAGHTIANHTYSHPRLDGLGREAFFSQVEHADQAIRAAIAGTPELESQVVSCLRPPYGDMDGYTRAYAAELGYQVVLWTIDPLDWTLPGEDAIVSAVMKDVKPGSIILMHDGGGKDRSQTVAALDRILSLLSAQGYRFEPVCR